jgi:hypothetical protein
MAAGGQANTRQAWPGPVPLKPSPNRNPEEPRGLPRWVRVALVLLSLPGVLRFAETVANGERASAWMVFSVAVLVGMVIGFPSIRLFRKRPPEE